MHKSRFFIIIIYFEICINSLECSNSGLYEIKYSGSYSFDANSVFITGHQNLIYFENTAYLKCLSKCNSITNCSSVVITKYNSSYSSCFGFNAFIDINTGITATNDKIIGQKILYKLKAGLTSSNKF